MIDAMLAAVVKLPLRYRRAATSRFCSACGSSVGNRHRPSSSSSRRWEDCNQRRLPVAVTVIAVNGIAMRNYGRSLSWRYCCYFVERISHIISVLLRHHYCNDSSSHRALHNCQLRLPTWTWMEAKTDNDQINTRMADIHIFIIHMNKTYN